MSQRHSVVRSGRIHAISVVDDFDTVKTIRPRQQPDDDLGGVGIDAVINQVCDRRLKCMVRAKGLYQPSVRLKSDGVNNVDIAGWAERRNRTQNA